LVTSTRTGQQAAAWCQIPNVRRSYDEPFRSSPQERYTKHEVRKNVNALGLTTRRGKSVPSQTFDAMLRNRAYIAHIDVPDFGISNTR
jgi:hypothetical protein